MLIILYEMYWTLKTHFIRRLSMKKNIMARYCRYFVLCSAHLEAVMIPAVEGCLTRSREVSSPPPHLYLISNWDRQWLAYHHKHQTLTVIFTLEAICRSLVHFFSEVTRKIHLSAPLKIILSHLRITHCTPLIRSPITQVLTWACPLSRQSSPCIDVRGDED